uniref:Uncharacterized protein n=1 Tax=viral metagenome TaxID=1070528 RepID=A0A6M3Y404_9ZZZZ
MSHSWIPYIIWIAVIAIIFWFLWVFVVPQVLSEAKTLDPLEQVEFIEYVEVPDPLCLSRVEELERQLGIEEEQNMIEFKRAQVEVKARVL